MIWCNTVAIFVSILTLAAKLLIIMLKKLSHPRGPPPPGIPAPWWRRCWSVCWVRGCQNCGSHDQLSSCPPWSRGSSSQLDQPEQEFENDQFTEFPQRWIVWGSKNDDVFHSQKRCFLESFKIDIYSSISKTIRLNSNTKISLSYQNNDSSEFHNIWFFWLSNYKYMIFQICITMIFRKSNKWTFPKNSNFPTKFF